MKIKLKPITKTFELDFDFGEVLDENAAKPTVTIRQVKTGDIVRLGDLFSEQTQIWDDAQYGQVKLQRKWNPEELKRERAFCTLVGADLEDENGNPVFKFKSDANGPALSMSRNDFFRAWDSLPYELTNEIYGYIVDVNEIWDFSSSGE